MARSRTKTIVVERRRMVDAAVIPDSYTTPSRQPLV